MDSRGCKPTVGSKKFPDPVRGRTVVGSENQHGFRVRPRRGRDYFPCFNRKLHLRLFMF
jgi:hypothetical protein